MIDHIDNICEILTGKDKFLITSHVNPEGDAIGSEMALALALRKLGKSVYVVNQDPIPYFLEFLPGVESVIYEDPGIDFDAGIILDCSTPGRTGRVSQVIARCPRVICIDHHFTNGGYGELHYCDAEASSTGELIFKVLEKMKIDIDPDIATALWVAISTDTGSFRYSNVTGDSLSTAAELVESGADPGWISEQLYEMEPRGRITLLSRALSTLEVVDGGRIASITIYQKDLDDVGGRNDFLDGFINYPRSIRGVSVAVSFREEGNGTYKVSLRAKGDADVAAVASSFGGGGHIKAAGFSMRGRLKNVKKKVYERITQSRTSHGDKNET